MATTLCVHPQPRDPAISANTTAQSASGQTNHDPPRKIMKKRSKNLGPLTEGFYDIDATEAKMF